LSDDWPEVLWRADEHEELTERTWDENGARDALGEIVADAEEACADGFWPGHPRDDAAEGPALCTLYLGSAGMIWGLRELGSAIDVRDMIAVVIDRYRWSPDFGEGAHAPSLWMGETGLLVVAARVGSPAADRERLCELVHENREHPTWELMWGSPGTMLAARACGLENEWLESAKRVWGRWHEATDLWTQSLYGRVAEFLGPAHGFAGNVHALRGYVGDEILRERVTRVLERNAMRKDELVNWRPVTESTQRSDAIRVQWCHGAPGIVVTLGDLMPLHLALAGGELTWRAGPLRKGGGLCHGTAGNGFAFLKLFALTGEERWLDRARRFAMHAIEQVQRERRRIGRGRYTLWTGDIGVALYLRACLDADPTFPTIDNL
jgi:Lanthionine synthetase C-like protein